MARATDTRTRTRKHAVHKQCRRNKTKKRRNGDTCTLFLCASLATPRTSSTPRSSSSARHSGVRDNDIELLQRIHAHSLARRLVHDNGTSTENDPSSPSRQWSALVWSTATLLRQLLVDAVNKNNVDSVWLLPHWATRAAEQRLQLTTTMVRHSFGLTN